MIWLRRQRNKDALLCLHNSWRCSLKAHEQASGNRHGYVYQNIYISFWWNADQKAIHSHITQVDAEVYQNKNIVSLPSSPGTRVFVRAVKTSNWMICHTRVVTTDAEIIDEVHIEAVIESVTAQMTLLYLPNLNCTLSVWNTSIWNNVVEWTLRQDAGRHVIYCTAFWYFTTKLHAL